MAHSDRHNPEMGRGISNVAAKSIGYDPQRDGALHAMEVHITSLHRTMDPIWREGECMWAC